MLFSPAHATTFSSAIAFTNTTPGCRFTVSLADGCVGAQAHGTLSTLRLGDFKSVVDLAIDSGSGYTPGTYTWTSSGGGCTRNATGTVTVSAGGLLGGQSGSNARGTTYTISDGGAGCTSRPTIAVPVGAGAGSAGAIVANVFQLTPHNSAGVLGSTFSIPGVDYPVGYDTSLVLKDPTTAPLPAGATYVGGSTHRVTLAGSGGTLSGYDFENSVTLEVTVNGWTITNNKFVCSQSTAPSNQSQIQVDSSVTGAVVIKYNYFDGGAGPNGTPCLTGGLTGNVSSSQEGGSMVFDYNYCVDADSKCLNMNGLLGSATVTVEEKYNMYVNFGIAAASASHGEAEYSFCGGAGIGQTYTWNAQFNVAYDQYWAGGTNLTSQFAFAEADGCHHLNDVFHYNYGIAFGNQLLTGSNNNNAQVSSAVQFCGTQESGTASGQVMTNNLHYYAGSFFPYNNTSSTCASVMTPADYNAGTGNVCNLTSCN